MLKGYYKKKKGFFKPGHSYHPSSISTPDVSSPSGYMRLSQEKFDMVVSSSSRSCYTVCDSEGNVCLDSVKLLRPHKSVSILSDEQKDVQKVASPEKDTNRLLNMGLTRELWVAAIRGHTDFQPGCDGDLDWDLTGEVKWGLGWQERLKCGKCNYVSPKFKLYTQVESNKRGPKAAAVNYGVQVGLSHTSISNTGMCNILYAMNTPAPSPRGMQKCTNIVSDSVIKCSEHDMASIRKSIVEVNKLRGAENTSVNVEMDCRYNNPIHSGVGKTPFQAGTQVTHVTVENTTPTKKVINVVNKSKLCQKCAVNKIKKGVKCAHNCSANISMESTIGNEEEWARESISILNRDGIHVKHVTTDPDSKTYKALEKNFEEGLTTSKPVHQIDTRHLGNNQRKYIKNSKFSDNMFPGRLSKDRKNSQSRFALDLSRRCEAEHEAAVHTHAGEIAKVKQALTKRNFLEAIIACYQCDHRLCKRNSYVCQAGKNKNWVSQSKYLKVGFEITPSNSDSSELVKCIEYRLGSKMLDLTQRLLNTQKTEAVNRAISGTAPKTMTFPRNYSGRVHSAVHAVNRGVGNAIFTECQYVGAPLTRSSRVTRGLQSIQKMNNMRKQHKKSDTAKCKRHEKVRRLHTIHDNMSDKKNETTYRKGLLVSHFDHSYCKGRGVPSDHNSYCKKRK